MKIISLNTWGGRAGNQELLSFFSQHKEDIDIFCLQEMWSSTYGRLDGKVVGGQELSISKVMTDGIQQISSLLDNHNLFFHPHHEDNYGLVMFVKKDLQVIDSGDIFVHKDRDYLPPPDGDVGLHARNVQYVTISKVDKKITVMNFHGLWNGQGKGDSADRLEQSRKIISFTETLQNPFVICGDFNLLPTTESVLLLENSGMRNLIKEYNITSTRTSFYSKPEKFADYAFVSQLEVVDFKVLLDEVSDHSPLYLEVKF